MQFQVRNLAIRQYRDRIDPDATDDQAMAAVLAAVKLCNLVPSTRPDGVRRLRVPNGGGQLARCYLLVGPTGDVIGVQPAHERRGGVVLPEVRRHEPTRRELERQLHERALAAGQAQAGENRRHPGARIVRPAPKKR